MHNTRNNLKNRLLAAIAATGGLVAFSASPALADHHMEKKAETPDIVATAMSTGMHETLVTAVKAAGLVETLQGAGPFTVFAPTDTAFSALPEGTVAALVKPENKATLTKVLTYHVLPGKVTAEELIALINANDGSAVIKTLEGSRLDARLVDGAVVLTDAMGGTATVVKADVATSNGVIHVTDGVFLPG